jgi:hypothetical protein
MAHVVRQFLSGQVDHSYALFRQLHEKRRSIDAGQQCRCPEEGRFISNSFIAMARRASRSNSAGVF